LPGDHKNRFGQVNDNYCPGPNFLKKNFETGRQVTEPIKITTIDCKAFSMPTTLSGASRPPLDDFFAPFVWRVAHGRTIELGPKAILVGILNVTPDSFSDGGCFLDPVNAMLQAEKMIAQGAAIIDIGGESTRPDATSTSAEQEQARILPVIAGLASRQPDVLISVDSWRSETAYRAIECGAHIVNDIWGLQKDVGLPAMIAETGAGLIAMHNGRNRERNRDVIVDQQDYLSASLSIAADAGIKRESIVLDPGFGFAKNPDENLELLAFLDHLHEFGQPLLVGTSRKRFVGHIVGDDTTNRDIGTAATNVVARMKGAALFRVHDVAVNRDALAMADAIIAAGSRDG
jgi:dihydropteroate synthase